MASRRWACGTVIMPAPAIIRCLCSTTSAIWNAALCVPATCTARTVGRKYSTRSWRVTGARSRASISAPTRASLTLKSMISWKPSGSSMRSGFRPTGFYRIGSATCSSAQSGDRRTRRVGSMPTSPIRLEAGPKPRRVIAKVEFHPGELVPRVGFIVTNLSRPVERVVTFYNKRGTCEQWIKEGKNAIKWTRLSCCSFAANAVRLQLHAWAYNLANFMRTLALPDAVKHWSLTSLREKLVKIGAKVVRHARYAVFQMAEVAVPRELFAEILRMIDGLRPQPAPA